MLTAALMAAPPDPVFTYQGVLDESGSPAEGVFDLRFRLFDAAAGGSELGVAVIADHPVNDGRLTAELDFGDPFDGRALWLEIEVRPGASTGTYTTLTPRQPLTAAPYARFAADAGHAATADSATTATDADTLDGEHGAFYRTWSSRTGVPAGLDDGDDDVLGELACAVGEVATWSGSAWVCDSDDGAVWARTVVVPGSGDPTANGTSLLAAVAAIPEPSSQEEAWRIRLEPGTYDLGVQRLDTKPWTVLEGAGQGVSLITSEYCYSGGVAVGVITGDPHVEIRDLTVENTCASAVENNAAITFDLDEVGGRLTRVTARAVGGADRCIGVSMRGDSSILERVTAEAHGGATRNTGINSEGDGSLVLDCVATATGGGIHTALRVSGASRVSRGSFEADDDPHSADSAVKIEGNVEMLDLTVASDNVAVQVAAWENLTVTLTRMDLRGQVKTVVGTGSSLALIVEHSRIDSPGATIEGSPGAVIGVAATQLAGDPVQSGGGTVVCAGVWDESWIFHPNTCP
jgi:hypothetical protein